MALIKEVNGLKPVWGKNCYFSENATIVGEVVMGDECSVWFNAVVRGDVCHIHIGDRTNVQDGAVLHTTFKTGPLHIGGVRTALYNFLFARQHDGDFRVQFPIRNRIDDGLQLDHECLVCR